MPLGGYRGAYDGVYSPAMVMGHHASTHHPSKKVTHRTIACSTRTGP